MHFLPLKSVFNSVPQKKYASQLSCLSIAAHDSTILDVIANYGFLGTYFPALRVLRWVGLDPGCYPRQDTNKLAVRYLQVSRHALNHHDWFISGFPFILMLYYTVFARYESFSSSDYLAFYVFRPRLSSVRVR